VLMNAGSTPRAAFSAVEMSEAVSMIRCMGPLLDARHGQPPCSGVVR
jgi:hypothetical protein